MSDERPSIPVDPDNKRKIVLGIVAIALIGLITLVAIVSIKKVASEKEMPVPSKVLK
jgi:hypothetical protein